MNALLQPLDDDGHLDVFLTFADARWPKEGKPALFLPELGARQFLAELEEIEARYEMVNEAIKEVSEDLTVVETRARKVETTLVDAEAKAKTLLAKLGRLEEHQAVCAVKLEVLLHLQERGSFSQAELRCLLDERAPIDAAFFSAFEGLDRLAVLQTELRGPHFDGKNFEQSLLRHAAEVKAVAVARLLKHLSKLPEVPDATFLKSALKLVQSAPTHRESFEKIVAQTRQEKTLKQMRSLGSALEFRKENIIRQLLSCFDGLLRLVREVDACSEFFQRNSDCCS
eukprot:TRINITY_DN12541_c0_g1_i1.p1 TRINITY_DN12541_c0_g1~~TRINITY_DN12541_c0_g1_i1.p1  ORF type:complete len:284 (-),score=97.73 TRINITY_DN12541_c0_g1_i1:376-1227(-)